MQSLRQKKSEGYAALLIEHCESEQELPATIVAFLSEVHEQMKLPSLEEGEEPGANEQEIIAEPLAPDEPDGGVGT